MKQKLVYSLSLLAILSLFIQCDQEIEVDLPEYTSELVVESYLEEGLPYIVSVTESVSYFDPVGIPVIADADVSITHKGITDTLQFVDTLGIYINLDRLVTYDTEEPFQLNVSDKRGRSVSANTQFLARPNIDTITYSFNDSLQASVVMFFSDDANAENWYKVYYENRNSFDPDSLFTWEFPDDVFSGERTVSGVGFQFRLEDTVRVRLYNIPEDYYLFLESVNDAENASANPISRPARLVSNIIGGQGIFTALSYDEKTIIIQE